MINGNTQGIRQSLLAQMETMQEMECDRDTFLPEALMFAMSKYTGLLGREISVYLSRSGAYWLFPSATARPSACRASTTGVR